LPGHRRRARKQEINEIIRQHRAARIKPQQTLAVIQQQFPDLPVVLKDVLNERSRQRREFIDTHTPAEATILLLDEHGFYKDLVVGEDSRVKRLFFTDKESIDLVRRWHDVFILDCTYKTNEYNLPLLNIVAASCLNKTIQVGLCFLSGESEEDYDWVIKALQKFLERHRIQPPSLVITDRDLALMNALEENLKDTEFLLCRWHLNKDMLAYARTHVHRQIRNTQTGSFEDHESVNKVMELFWACLDADTEDVFDEACKSLERESSVCAKYLQTNWWPYKDKLVLAWTKKFTHFGEQVSSRAEGHHHRLKEWLGSSRNDLLGFLEACLPFFHLLYSEHTYLWSQQSISLPWAYRKELYVYVNRIISNYALSQVDQQYVLAKDELRKLRTNPQNERTKCRCIFRTVYGYPCKHDLMDLIENDQVLKPEMFHKHWWLDRGFTEEEGQRTRILEPNPIRQTRTDARKRKKGKSTQRVPSRFERVDQNHPASRNPSDNLPLTQPARQVRDLPTNEPIQVPLSQPLMQALPQQRQASAQHQAPTQHQGLTLYQVLAEASTQHQASQPPLERAWKPGRSFHHAANSSFGVNGGWSY
jgi:MULE transposase domain